VSHRGGFIRDPPMEDLTDPNFLGSFQNLSLVQQRQFAIMYGLAFDPVVQPIQEGTYSNMGYVIGAATVENITGIAWEDLIIEHLFDRLGMSSVNFLCPNTTQSPRGHVYNNETASLMPIPSVSRCDCMADMLSCRCDLPPIYGPAGLVHMQLLDYIKYYQWHLAGHRGEDVSGLLTAEEFQGLHTSMGPIGLGIPDAKPVEYGYGWLMIDHPLGEGKKIYAHSGSNRMWFAQVIMSPTEDRVIFLATNSIANTTGEPPLGLQTIMENLMQTATSNATTCTPLNQLGVNPELENDEEECDELVYGVDKKTDTSDTWEWAASVRGPLLVLLLFSML